MSKETNPNIKSTIKSWGIGLIIIGILPFLIPSILSIEVGILAIILGVIALVFRAKWVMALVGAIIILVGVLNVITVLISQEGYLWVIIGIIQILIGISALNEYHKDGKEKYKQSKTFKERWKEQKTWEKVIIILAGIIIVSMIWSALFPTP